MDIDTRCPVCWRFDEDGGHCFLKCKMAWWDARNKANAGEKKILSIEEVMYRAQSMSVDSLIDKQQSFIKPLKVIPQWCPPKSDFLKINFDDAFLQERKSGEWGFVIRDHEGSALVAGIGKLGKKKFMMPFVQKDKHAWLLLLRQLIKVLVKALKSNEYDHSLGGVLFREAKFLLST
ncbi:hypothetical protein HU200_015267 [Digitaria exilis]|uniref:Uncharacterized protein n=1 Tax=Digitaria exilis TaxID=1010633 RepID=A0A835FAG1_9POAL|nr:hypothetical protein HU200_015267 [Digitaria exilis]